MRKMLILCVCFWAGLISQALANHPGPDGDTVAIAETPAITSEKGILKLNVKPDVEFTEDGYLKITIPSKKTQVFYAKLNGKPFPDGTEYQVEETTSAIGKTYLIKYRLPGTQDWAPVMINMVGEMTPYNKRLTLKGDTLPGDPEGTLYKVINGVMHKRLPNSEEWVPVGGIGDKIEIYRLAVYDPRHPKKKIGDHFIAYNRETGDTVVIVGNFTDWARTIRRIVYAVAGGGTACGLAWIAFLFVFMA